MSHEYTSFIIRSATTADVAAIHALQVRWAADDSTYGFVADTPERITALLGRFYLVAEVDGRVVGFINGLEPPSQPCAVVPEGAKPFEIEGLYLEPAHRSRGIGSALVQRLLEVAQAHGFTHTLLYSSVKDLRPVMKFYEAHGFRTWYVQMFREL